MSTSWSRPVACHLDLAGGDHQWVYRLADSHTYLGSPWLPFYSMFLHVSPFYRIVLHSARTQCRKFEIKIPQDKELRGHSPSSYIPVSLSDLYIPMIGLPILLQENRWTTVGIYRWIWKLGMTPCNIFLGINKSKFLCSAIQYIGELQLRYMFTSIAHFYVIGH
jgi:hypothetical protein